MSKLVSGFKIGAVANYELLEGKTVNDPVYFGIWLYCWLVRSAIKFLKVTGGR